MTRRAIAIRGVDKRLRQRALALASEVAAREAEVDAANAEAARQEALQVRHAEPPPIPNDRARLSCRQKVLH